MEAINVYGIALVPVVMAMVELLKRVGIPKKFSPIVAIILGILAGFYYLAPDDPPKAIFLGIVVGLSAIGLFSGAKNTIENLGGNSNSNYHKVKPVRKRPGSH
jgi:hypothetical protein